jgi:hypothetical protein
MEIRILFLSSSKIIDTSFLSLVMLLYTGISFYSCIISLVIYSTISYSVFSVEFKLLNRSLGVSAVSSRLLRRLWAFDLFDEVFALSFVFDFFDLPFFLAIDDMRGRLYS